MAPAHSTRVGPKRSAKAPANGCAAPHSRFWRAIANENASRPQPRSNDSGVRNWPSAERGPNASNAMTQPTPINSRGLRQEASFEGADAAAIVMKRPGTPAPDSARRTAYLGVELDGP